MSRQVNFFADPQDAATLHAWLLQEFPGLTVIRSDRGPVHEMQPVPAAQALEAEEMMFLVPRWARDWLRFMLKTDDTLILDRFISPIIEYRPSILDQRANRLTVGRIYWGYCCELDPDEKRQLDRMFRWLRARTQRLSADGPFRMFRHASQEGRVFDYGFDIIRPAPPWRE